MDKSKLIGGIICLAIAAFLTVLNFRLPEDSLMFMVGNVNMPWVPVVVLAVVGIVLLATAGSGKAEEKVEKEPVEIDPEKAALNKRLESVAWGCFLIMLGGFMFVPEQIIKGGWWSVGVGLIMLGLNVARYFYGLKMSGFTTFLGVLSVISGAFEIFGFYELDGAILLIILGAYLIIKPWFEKRKLFGKAEAAN